MRYLSGGAASGTWLGRWNRTERDGVPLARISAVVTTVLDDRPVALTGGDGACHVWDLAEGDCLGEVSAGVVEDMAVISLRSRPVVAVKDHNPRPVGLWEVATGQHIGDLPDEQAESVAAVTIGGRPVAVTGHWDMTVRLWDLNTFRQIGRPLTGHRGTVRRVTTALVRGRPLAVTSTDMDVDQSFDQQVRVWDLEEGEQISALPAATGSPVSALAVTALDGRPVVATGSWDGSIGVWDMASGQRLRTWLTESLFRTPSVTALAAVVLHGRTALVSGHGDGSVRTWDAQTGEQVGQTLGLNAPPSTSAPHPAPLRDSSVTLTCDPGGSVVICSGREVAVLRASGG